MHTLKYFDVSKEKFNDKKVVCNEKFTKLNNYAQKYFKISFQRSLTLQRAVQRLSF